MLILLSGFVGPSWYFNQVGIHLHYCIHFYNIVYLNFAMVWSRNACGRYAPGWISRRFVSVSWWLKVIVLARSCDSYIMCLLGTVTAFDQKKLQYSLLANFWDAFLFNSLKFHGTLLTFIPVEFLTLNLKILSSQYIRYSE